MLPSTDCPKRLLRKEIGMTTATASIPTLPQFDDITVARLQRLQAQLAESDFDALVCCGFENIQYATGYRSAPGVNRRAQRMAAIVTTNTVLLVGGTAESAPAIAGGFAPDRYIPYGTFFFDSIVDDHPALQTAPQQASLGSAVAYAARLISSAGVVGVDNEDCSIEVRDALVNALPGASFRNASGWLQSVRSIKLPGEVDRLRHAARLAENGVTAAIEAARPGVTENELAAIVARTMSEGGAIPKFITLTTGVRSALADEFSTDAVVREGDLLRFDIGCDYDGYRSDIGRTAVIGEPTALQSDRYAAILAGELREIEIAAPGVPAAQLFNEAIETVEAAGVIKPYRRQHAGHGIGQQIYEGFRVASDETHVLEVGNVLCVETPYYVLGWGGMMVEDTLVITEDGCESLTISTRDLRVVS
ncbi:M24 family metallopeptidase [Rhodococcus sp. JS3073]|uniref:M24 family metallopeptidase n=1 Tax=Rhodococcus sp. JS3073 TaxID=3002901 RepID=UPI002285D8B1|nr:Xaa-Pro peptidase family protein [Rhodococcus sp. JS3073]WAM19555.1 Xaa-Pro peptidase family protein [Rhodococcus sp. JS3073]